VPINLFHHYCQCCCDRSHNRDRNQCQPHRTRTHQKTGTTPDDAADAPPHEHRKHQAHQCRPTNILLYSCYLRHTATATSANLNAPGRTKNHEAQPLTMLLMLLRTNTATTRHTSADQPTSFSYYCDFATPRPRPVPTPNAPGLRAQCRRPDQAPPVPPITSLANQTANQTTTTTAATGANLNAPSAADQTKSTDSAADHFARQLNYHNHCCPWC
jgi:hypothetical protein